MSTRGGMGTTTRWCKCPGTRVLSFTLNKQQLLHRNTVLSQILLLLFVGTVLCFSLNSAGKTKVVGQKQFKDKIRCVFVL